MKWTQLAKSSNSFKCTAANSRFLLYKMLDLVRSDCGIRNNSQRNNLWIAIYFFDRRNKKKMAVCRERNSIELNWIERPSTMNLKHSTIKYSAITPQQCDHRRNISIRLILSLCFRSLLSRIHSSVIFLQPNSH